MYAVENIFKKSNLILGKKMLLIENIFEKSKFILENLSKNPCSSLKSLNKHLTI